MTVKQFFKSKTFVCIIVLLCIALVSGGLLAIMNDLLNVSDEERVQRTITSIYGQSVDYTVVEADFSTEHGTVDAVYRLADGNYLVKATGKEGYKNGTVTIWCVAKYDNNVFVGLTNVSIADNEKQTLMSKFTADVLSRFGGKESNNVAVSGATYSAKACNNAVNAALAYVATLEGGNQ